jgi:hypothetical protein
MTTHLPDGVSLDKPDGAACIALLEHGILWDRL